MKKFAWIVLLGFVLILFEGCIVSHPTTAPPPPKTEFRPTKPGSNYVWISGHWKWTGNHYKWVPGYWTKARRGKVWVKGHWEKRGPHWVWIKGHWN